MVLQRSVLRPVAVVVVAILIATTSSTGVSAATATQASRPSSVARAPASTTAPNGEPQTSPTLVPPAAAVRASGPDPAVLDRVTEGFPSARTTRVLGREHLLKASAARPASATSGPPSNPNAPPLRPASGDPLLRASRASVRPSTPATGDVTPDVTGPSITGTVKNTKGTVLQGITVTAYPQGSGIGPVSTTTSSGGTYAVAVSGGGSWYIVSFVDPTGTYFGGYYGGGGLILDYEYTPVITVGSGPVTANVTLPTAYHLKGQVTDQVHTGIGSLQINALPTTGHLLNVADATTDAGGSYSVAVPPGTYHVSVDDTTKTFASGCWSTTGITADWATCTVYSVVAADVTIDMTLPPIPHVTGTVTSASSGLGVSASLTLADASSGSFITSGSSAPDGTYSLAVDPGTYTLELPAGVDSGWYSRSGWTPQRSQATEMVVTAGGDTSGIDVAVPSFSNLSGNVAGSGCTVGSVEVDVYDEYAGFYGYVVTTTGNYSMSVPPGTYFVGFFDASGQCASGWYGSSGFVAGSSAASPVVVTMAQAGSASVALPTARVLRGSAAIYGNVTEPNMIVEAWLGSDLYLTGSIGTDGNFALPVAPGTYTIWVSTPDGWPVGGWYRAGGLTYDPSVATRVVVSSKNVSITIALRDGPQLSGKVTGPGGVAEPGVLVVAYLSGNEVGWGTTNANGVYAFSVAAGTYTVLETGGADLLPGWYAHGGFAEKQASASPIAVSKDVSNINIAVPAGHDIRGVVTGAGAAGLHDVAIEVFRGGSLYELGFSGYGGEYSLLAIAGSYQIGYVDPFEVYGIGWYSGSGIVEDFALADTLVVATTDLTGLDVQLQPMAPPDAPTGTIGSGFDDGAIVSWLASAGDGWSPITGYTVTASPGGATCMTHGALFCSVTGLTDGTPYTFTVVATNSIGDSDPSTASDPVTPTTVPAPPTTVTAAGVDAAAVVWWSASATGPVTGYAVTSTPGGFHCSTTGALACKVTGLTNLTSYTFTVSVTGAGGTGPDSGPSNAVMPQAGATLRASRLDNATYGDLAAYPNDRFATDAAVAEQAFPFGAPTVYVADGLNFPDALGADAAAAKAGGPVLLVTPTSIPAVIAHALSSLHPSTIYVVGGPASVSGAVLTALEAYATSVIRLDNATFPDLAGYPGDRFSTDAAVAEQAFPAGASTVYVADGLAFPDALGAGAAAAKTGGPVLLVTPTSIPAAIMHELAALHPTTIYVVGGPAAVSASVMTALAAYATDPPVRLDHTSFPDLVGYAGDRFGTDAAVVEQTFGGGALTVYIADGLNFPDALGAGAAAAEADGPVLLVTPTSIPAAVAHELSSLRPTQIYVVGGAASVSSTVLDALAPYFGP